jgi:hypothetical protein
MWDRGMHCSRAKSPRCRSSSTTCRCTPGGTRQR